MSAHQMMVDWFRLDDVEGGDHWTYMKASFDQIKRILPTQAYTNVKKILIRLSEPVTQGSIEFALMMPIANPQLKTVTSADGDLIWWDLPDDIHTFIGDDVQVWLRVTPSSDLNYIGRITAQVMVHHDNTGDWYDNVACYKTNAIYKKQGYDFLIEACGKYIAFEASKLSKLYFRWHDGAPRSGPLTISLKVNDSEVKNFDVDVDAGDLSSLDLSSDNISLAQGDVVSASYEAGKKFNPSGQKTLDMGLEVKYAT